MPSVPLSSLVGGGKIVVRKQQVFTASGNFTGPANLVGNICWITGCGAGGSGGASGGGNSATGGWGGAYCIRMPVTIDPLEVVAVTIGAGGAGRSGVSGNGNDGGNTTFGTKLTLRGGSKGLISSTEGNFSSATGFGIRPEVSMLSSAQVVWYTPADTVEGNVCGLPYILSGGTQAWTGGACGLFGNGTNAANGIATASAAANSGAGSGSTSGSTTGNGGSGKLIVEWEELVDAE